jgi:N-acetylmuramoyl-L-alanine amidase
MVESINSVSSAAKAREAKSKRESEIMVRSGETLAVISKKFGMSPSEFKQWAGLKNSSLKAGQKIKLPTDEVPEHKGLLALAKKYGMTLDEFCKLNGISRDYQPSKGEKFYVKKSAVEAPSVKHTQTKAQVTKSQTSTGKRKDVQREQITSNMTMDNNAKYGSSYTPEDLGRQIYQKSSDYYGAVGKPDFNALLNEITAKNVQEVLEKYEGLNHGESLINTITSEVGSKKSARKEAVMKIYDTISESKGIDLLAREAFEAELNSQFDSWGMVNTKKLDEMISEKLNGDTKSSSASSASGAKSSNVKSNNTMVTYAKGKMSRIDLQRGAIASAKGEAKDNFREYCKANNIPYDEKKLDLSPMERIPVPEVDKNGNIKAAESEVLPPTGKSNGKVVILNTGHGGYSSKTGYFDTGSYSFIKKANGKYAPLLEYDKMKRYGDGMVEKLRSQGYSVVLTSGHAQTIQADNSMTKIVDKLKSGANSKKYTSKDIVFVSLHADSEKGKSGTGVLYDSKNSYDIKFAESINKNLDSQSWITSKTNQRNHEDNNGLLVLKQTDAIPSVLVEVEYVNGSKSKNLDSSAFQTQFENGLLNGINEYFGIH